MKIILKREDLIMEGEPGEYFDIKRLENDIKEISNKDPEGRIKVLHKMRPIAIFKPTSIGPSGKPEEVCIEGEPPYIKMRIYIDDAHDYYISNVVSVRRPVCLSEYITKYKQYHYRFYDHTRGEDSVLLKPGDMVKLTAIDNYRELRDVGCIVGACSTNTIMLAVADPNLIRATNSRRYDGDVVTKIVLKADILGDENEVREFQIEKIE
jgi:hypothetical protein